MKKPDHFFKRILMSAIGVVICGVSVGMFKHASLGVDPFQSLMSGLDAVIPISFGTLYVLVNLVLLVFALIFDRRKIGLAEANMSRTIAVTMIHERKWGMYEIV